MFAEILFVRCYTYQSESCRLTVEGRNKLSVSEYVAVFLKLHGLLHNCMDLQEAEKCVKILMTTLTAHVATESLTSWKLVQVCSNFLLGIKYSVTLFYGHFVQQQNHPYGNLG
jgi:hypothetical protein